MNGGGRHCIIDECFTSGEPRRDRQVIGYHGIVYSFDPNKLKFASKEYTTLFRNQNIIYKKTQYIKIRGHSVS